MNYNLATIFFSKDRAMQLHACISSLKKHAQFYEYADCFVLYKSDKYQYQYEILAEEFKEVSFIRETNLTEQAYNITAEYDAIMFVVDDTLFYRDFNLAMCVHHLFTNPKVLGFSLRLGHNVTWSHIINKNIEHPSFSKLVDNYFKFTWPGKDRDFGYPLEVSSSIYRTCDVRSFLKEVKGDPGAIEGYLSQQKKHFRNTMPELLCFDKSVAFGVPVNIVRDKTRCPAGRDFPCATEKLAALFDEGKRIDVSAIPKEIIGVHQEVEYKFK